MSRDHGHPPELRQGERGFTEIVQRGRAQYMTAGDMTYGVLREAILNGTFAPGERLLQDILAEEIGVSRMPVRSALLRLESDGLVHFHPHRGAVVVSLSPAQIIEIYEARLALESYALQRAIGEMKPDRLERLEKIAAQLDSEEEGERFYKLRTEFYSELYDTERYPTFVGLIERLRADVGRYWTRLRLVDREESGHQSLLEFVRRKDVDGALAWLRSHLENVSRQLARLVAADGKW